MRVTTNLASRPFTDLGPILKRLRIGMVVVALVGVALGAGLYTLHNKAEVVRAREHSLDSNIATVRNEESSYESLVRQPDNSQVLEHATTLNRLFDEKAFSWTLAMEDLETVLPGGVQVTTLEPMRDKKDGHITLRMRVTGPRDKAVELVQNLERSRHFLSPRITGETSEASGNGNQALEPVSPSNRVNFDLLADYNPAASGDRRSGKKDPSVEEVSDQAPARHSARRMREPAIGRVPASPSSKMVPPHPGGAL